MAAPDTWQHTCIPDLLGQSFRHAFAACTQPGWRLGQQKRTGQQTVGLQCISGVLWPVQRHTVRCARCMCVRIAVVCMLCSQRLCLDATRIAKGSYASLWSHLCYTACPNCLVVSSVSVWNAPTTLRSTRTMSKSQFHMQSAFSTTLKSDREHRSKSAHSRFWHRAYHHRPNGTPEVCRVRSVLVVKKLTRTMSKSQFHMQSAFSTTLKSDRKP